MEAGTGPGHRVVALETDFWHDRWQEGRIGFHQDKPSPLLVQHIQSLALRSGDRVFVPLCGKTLDIGWLREQGMRVAGAELSEIAVRQLFEELGTVPEIIVQGALKLYRSDGLDIHVGDIFDLERDVLGRVDAVFDRAALVALPRPMRVKYAAHLAAITSQAHQFLITFDYDQSKMAGPPFSVPDDEVEALYAKAFTLDRLTSVEVEGGLKGMCPATANLWLLSRPD